MLVKRMKKPLRGGGENVFKYIPPYGMNVALVAMAVVAHNFRYFLVPTLHTILLDLGPPLVLCRINHKNGFVVILNTQVTRFPALFYEKTVLDDYWVRGQNSLYVVMNLPQRVLLLFFFLLFILVRSWNHSNFHDHSSFPSKIQDVPISTVHIQQE